MNPKRLILWILIAAVVYTLGYFTYRLFFKPDYSSIQNQPAPKILK